MQRSYELEVRVDHNIKDSLSQTYGHTDKFYCRNT